MKFIAFASLVFGLLAIGCSGSSGSGSSQKPDYSDSPVVVENANVPAKEKERPATVTSPLAKPDPNAPPPAPPQPIEYEGLMVEYHDMLCRQKAGRSANEPEDVGASSRLRDIARDLDNMGKKLTADAKMQYNLALKKAKNLQNCPK